jgi:uncharacterized membrane protein
MAAMSDDHSEAVFSSTDSAMPDKVVRRDAGRVTEGLAKATVVEQRRLAKILARAREVAIGIGIAALGIGFIVLIALYWQTFFIASIFVVTWAFEKFSDKKK